MMRNGAKAYVKTKVFTSEPGRLVLMCYEGAIDNLKIAEKRIAEKDCEGKAKALGKARDFIEELLLALDHEKGGIIARNLASLYNYMLRRIIRADLRKDLQAIQEVSGMLNELRGAWEGVLINQAKKTHQPKLKIDRRGRPLLATGS